MTLELEAEGVARDFVRLVQQARKDAGLHVSDRIRLTAAVDAAVGDALLSHRDYVREQVLAESLEFGPAADGAFGASGKVGSEGVAVSLSVQAV